MKKKHTKFYRINNKNRFIYTLCLTSLCRNEFKNTTTTQKLTKKKWNKTQRRLIPEISLNFCVFTLLQNDWIKMLFQEFWIDLFSTCRLRFKKNTKVTIFDINNFNLCKMFLTKKKYAHFLFNPKMTWEKQIEIQYWNKKIESKML